MEDFVVLDMCGVADIDASGVAVLQQVARRFEDNGKAIAVCGASPKVSKLVRSALGKPRPCFIFGS